MHPVFEGIRLISLDLDDTLWHNPPVLERAERRLLDHLASHFPDDPVTLEELHAVLQRIKASHPDIHDVTELRRRVLKQLGTSRRALSDEEIEQALELFIVERSKVTVEKPEMKVLEALAKKFQLVTITNGNCRIDHLPMHTLISRHYQAGPDGPAKPEAAMLLRACQDMGVSTNELLHIGDSLETDYQAARNAGARFIWIRGEQAIEKTMQNPRFHCKRFEALYDWL